MAAARSARRGVVEDGGRPRVAAGWFAGLRRSRRARKARAEQPLEQRILLTATLCLLAFGAVMVYSASSARGVLQGQGSSGYLVRFLIYGGLGLLAMHWLARTPLDVARRATGPLLATSLVLLVAVRVPHVGVAVNGGRRWLGAGPLQFQPSELAKLALVLHAASVLARRPRAVRDLRALRPLLLLTGACVLLIVIEPDIGTAMVIALTMTLVLVAAGIPGRNLLIILGGAFAMVLLYALVKPYARARLTSFLDPWAHAGSTGFQAVQGQIAIGSGGLFGRGPGESVQKVFYLPEAQTDFILAVIGEELGAVGVCSLLFLYGLIVYGGLRAARKARSFYSALIAVGVTCLIATQAILNVFAVLGLAPLTGVPLPFVSYGSSNLLVMLACMGLLLNVAAGGTAHLRAVPAATPGRRSARSASGRSNKPPQHEQRTDEDADRDRRRRDRRARRAGARRGRGAAG
jgi:cell division protein FtsW